MPADRRHSRNNMFYPDIKPHISPSAFANWHEARSLFVRSYFLKEKTPETASMKAGKQIHALIEAGLLEVKHRYAHREKKLTVMLQTPETMEVLGIPDSFERHWTGAKEGEGEPYDTAFFVDYKSGKENNWDDTKLAGDLKMKATAWLVWNKTDKPSKVVGFIEYIPTAWNASTREIEPTGGESVVAGEIVYTSDELEAFTEVIAKTIAEVNLAYTEWLESTDEFVNQDDVAEYAQLDQEVKEREVKMGLIKERIGDQMGMGGKETLPTPFGSFYFTARKTYSYPEEIELASAEVAAKKKKFETENEPAKVTKSLSFRAKK